MTWLTPCKYALLLLLTGCANAAPWEPCSPPFVRVPVLGGVSGHDTVTWRVVCP